MTKDQAEAFADFMNDNDASFIWVPQPRQGGDYWMVEGYDGPYGLPESEVVVRVYDATVSEAPIAD